MFTNKPYTAYIKTSAKKLVYKGVCARIEHLTSERMLMPAFVYPTELLKSVPANALHNIILALETMRTDIDELLKIYSPSNFDCNANQWLCNNALTLHADDKINEYEYKIIISMLNTYLENANVMMYGYHAYANMPNIMHYLINHNTDVFINLVNEYNQVHNDNATYSSQAFIYYTSCFLRIMWLTRAINYLTRLETIAIIKSQSEFTGIKTAKELKAIRKSQATRKATV